MQTNNTICSLLHQHNEKGMQYLFDRYYKPLVVWAASFLNDVAQAEDVVQDFFIKIWEKENGRRLQPETLKAFLYTSVRNLALDRLEKKDPLHHTTDFNSIDKSWEEYDNFKEEMFRLIKKEVDKLPPRSREIIQCVYLKGMRYKETAALLGISVATVNTLLVNALKKIREITDSPEHLQLFFFMIREDQRLTDNPT